VFGNDSAVIATELADKSLAYRLEELEKQGESGIPTVAKH